MNKKLLVIVGLVCLLVLPASTPVFGWDKIVSFGDSLSDDGNGGRNNFPGFPYDTGPASDGDVWLEYLASSMIDVELEGRAIGGAQTSGPTPAWAGGLDIGMEEQIDRYLLSLGTPPEDGHNLSGILFTVWIGGNDFLANPANPFAAIDPAMNRIETSIQQLVDAGAEDILVMTLPDLGLAPGVFLQYGEPGAALYTAASESFNTSLTERICTLRDVNSEENIKFYMADTFELLQYAVENGEALGLPYVDYPCTYPLPPDYTTYLPCDQAVFWDGIHPTTATHKILAALALGQVKHGKVSKEMKNLLKKLNPIHPRKPFVVNCFE